MLKYLKAEKQTSQYFFQVQIDDTKKLTDGTPDPAYVREYSWYVTPPIGQTEADYLTNIKREIGLLVTDELSRILNLKTIPTPLTGF